MTSIIQINCGKTWKSLKQEYNGEEIREMMLKNSLDKYIQGGKRHEISDISIKNVSIIKNLVQIQLSLL